MKKKVVPKLRQKVKVKVDIVTSDDIKIYYTGKLQDFTARYIINNFSVSSMSTLVQNLMGSQVNLRRLIRDDKFRKCPNVLFRVL